GFPVSASDQSIQAQTSTYSFSPKAVTINVGDKVTWSTDGLSYHNVCVLKPGMSGDTCTASNQEFRNGDPAMSWSGYTNSHVFTTPGTYQFFCEYHKSLGMTGTITVTGDSTGTDTGTGTSTTPPPPPTDTTTVPTQTQTAPADTT